MSIRSRLYLYSALIAPLALLSAGAPANAADRFVADNASNASTYMPVGRRITPPTAFLEMCARSPVDCEHSDQADTAQIVVLARQALIEKYDRAFEHSREPSTGDISAAETDHNIHAAPEAQPAQPSLLFARFETSVTVPAQLPALAAPTPVFAIDITTRTAPLLADWRRLSPPPMRLTLAVTDTTMMDADEPVPGTVQTHAYARITVQAQMQVQAAAARPTRTTISDYTRIDLARGNTLATIKAVNNHVNRALIADTDAHLYHVNDYWEAPALTRGARGDCEDFALVKRRLLIEQGIPAAALSLAIVKTRYNEDHAVLIVSTLQGDLVLDNLAFDVKAWQKTSYTWVSRQSPGDDLDWVSLAPANGADTLRAPEHIAYNQ